MMSGAGLFPRFSLPRPAADTHAYWLDFMEEAGCRSLEELQPRPLDSPVRRHGADASPAEGHHLPHHARRRRGAAPRPRGPAHRIPLPLDYLIGYTNNDMYAPVMAFIGNRFGRKTGAWIYLFDLDAPGDDNRAFHSSDLRYVFGTLNQSWRPYGKRDREAARQIADYLANFARSGDPNGPGLPNWKRGGGRVLRIAPERTAMGLVNYLKLTRNMLTKGDPKDEI